MNSIFIIDDACHAETQGQYNTFDDAILELKKRMEIPWNQEPNICPCTNWETCTRNYVIIECDAISKTWKELKRTAVLNVSSKETKWLLDNFI